MKTEQEVRDAITMQDALVLAGDDYYCMKDAEETIKNLQNIAVIIGKALGVVE